MLYKAIMSIISWKLPSAPHHQVISWFIVVTLAPLRPGLWRQLLAHASVAVTFPHCRSNLYVIIT